MKLVACRVSFTRVDEPNAKWHYGVAICKTHGLSNVIAIYDDATNELVEEAYVWEYELDWTHSFDVPS